MAEGTDPCEPKNAITFFPDNKHNTPPHTTRRNHLVSTLFEAIAKKKEDLLVTVWEPGQDTQNKDPRDNGHVRQQRDDVIWCRWQFFFGRHQRGPAPYTKRNAMQRSKFDIGRADAGAGGMSMISGSGGASAPQTYMLFISTFCFCWWISHHTDRTQMHLSRYWSRA